MALANADERIVNPLVSAFTGSLASEIGLSSTDDVIVEFVDSACNFIDDGSCIQDTLEYNDGSGWQFFDGVTGNVCSYSDWDILLGILINSYSFRIVCVGDTEPTVFVEDNVILEDMTSSINDFCTSTKRFECTLDDLSLDPFYLTDYEGVSSEYRAAFKDCEDECVLPVTADSVRGFYDGNVDAITGLLAPDTDENTTNTYTQYQKPDGTYNDTEMTVTNTITPRVVNYGVGTRFGELGDYLGDTDIGQVRYFNQPFDMWEMLGFECDELLDSPIEEFKKWEVDYYQQTGTHASYNIDTISTLGSPTLSTTTDWSVTQAGNNGSGYFYDVHLLFLNDDGSIPTEINMNDASPGNGPTNFTVHYSTWIYVDESFSVDTGFRSDNRGYFYIDGEQVATDTWDDADTSDPYTYDFIGGNWYK
jgi:hypothetical protein